MAKFKYDTACLVTVVIEADNDEQGRKLLAAKMQDGATAKELETAGVTVTCIAGWDDPAHLIRVPEAGDPSDSHDLQKMRMSGDTALEQYRVPAPKL